MRPALLRMAIRYLEDSDDAEDVVQDVLLKLWFLREKLDEYRSVDALAIVVTKHLCINRMRGARIEKVELDKQGRILLPANLREFAGLDKDVVLVGVGSRIEIWSREKWESVTEEDNMDEITSAMEALGLTI